MLAVVAERTGPLRGLARGRRRRAPAAAGRNKDCSRRSAASASTTSWCAMEPIGVASDMPVILGHEVAGTVEQLGEGVCGVQRGDLVATTTYSHVCGHCTHCRGGHGRHRVPTVSSSAMPVSMEAMPNSSASMRMLFKRFLQAFQSRKHQSSPARSGRSSTPCGRSGECGSANACW